MPTVHVRGAERQLNADQLDGISGGAMYVLIRKSGNNEDGFRLRSLHWGEGSSYLAAPATIALSKISVAPRLRLALVIAAIVLCVAGAFRSGIFRQAIWDPIGQQRFFLYTGLFATASVLIFVVRRAILLPCYTGGVLLYTAALAGVQPAFALIFFALACYGIGLGLLHLLHLAGRERLRPLWLDIIAAVAGMGIWAFVVSLLAFTTWNWATVHGLLLAIPAIAAGRSIGFAAVRRSAFRA